MSELGTTTLHDLIARFQAGDNSALDLLIRRTTDRLEYLARRMLRGFPGVRAREQAEDVLQNGLIRLARALSQRTPPSVAEFFRLAAAQIRRELLDLARSHARHPTVTLAIEPADQGDDSVDLDRWTALHQAVENLPAAQRDVFSFTFYHGWTQIQIAQFLGCSDRQVRRLWVEACLRLKAVVGNLPAG
jgi:RNA polymerase sigma-70 factor (ECF subfamily)